jgi:hypothetical protein
LPSKELERILKLLHNEHQFDSVVLSHHKQWYFNMAHRYFMDYLRYNAKFESETNDFIYCTPDSLQRLIPGP